MYKDLYYSDSFFKMFVVPSFTYGDFIKHKDMVISVYNEFINEKIDKYPHGFWGSTMGLINTRIVLDYLVSKSILTVPEILKSNKKFLIDHKIYYQFFSFTVRELIETVYPDDYYKEKDVLAVSSDATTEKNSKNKIKVTSSILCHTIEDKADTKESKLITCQDAIKYFSNAIENENIKDSTQKQIYEFVVEELEKKIQRDELRVDLIDLYLNTGKTVKHIIKKYNLE